MYFYPRAKVDLSNRCPWDSKRDKTEIKKSSKSRLKDHEDSEKTTTTEEQHGEQGCDSEPLFGSGSSMCSLSLEEPHEQDPEDDAKCESEERLDNGHTMCSLVTDNQQDKPAASRFSFTPPSNPR